MTPPPVASVPRSLLLAAALLGLTGVALGAWGAHGLPETLADIYGMQSREVGGRTVPAAAKYRDDFLTGVRYQMMHAVAVLAIVGLPLRSRLRAAAGWAMVAGTVVFSGSLYALVLTATPWLGAVTPIGGVLLLAGWTLLLLAAVRGDRPSGEATS